MHFQFFIHFTYKYRGRKNCKADALLHCPQGEAPLEIDEEVRVAIVLGAEDRESDISTLLKLPSDDSAWLTRLS